MCQFLLYNIMNQLYINIYIQPSILTFPSTFPIPPLQVITEHQAELPVYSSFLLAIYFAHGSVSMSMLLSKFVPLSLPCCVHKSILYICVSILALQIGSSVPFFLFPHYVLIYDICFCFLGFCLNIFVFCVHESVSVL